MHRAHWDTLKRRPYSGQIYRRIEQLVEAIHKAMPSVADDEYQRKMQQLGRSPEVRELAQLGGQHLVGSMNFPKNGTDMDVIIWAHNRGVELVRPQLVMH